MKYFNQSKRIEASFIFLVLFICSILSIPVLFCEPMSSSSLKFQHLYLKYFLFLYLYIKLALSFKQEMKH